MADRQHKHRDLWVALAATLLLGGIGLSVAIWAVESAARHVGAGPHAGEVAGVILSVAGAYLAVSVVAGWPLPGGFAEPAAPAGTNFVNLSPNVGSTVSFFPNLPAAAPAMDRKDRLLAGERLSAGEELHSPDGTVQLTMGRDGNLTVSAGLLTLWDSITAQTGSENYLEFRPNGNMFLRKGDGTPVLDWQAGGMGGEVLVLQDDGNLVLYARGGRTVWASDRLKGGLAVIPNRPDLRAHPKRLI